MYVFLILIFWKSAEIYIKVFPKIQAIDIKKSDLACLFYFSLSE